MKFHESPEYFAVYAVETHAYSKSRTAEIQRDNKMTKECPLSEICIDGTATF